MYQVVIIDDNVVLLKSLTRSVDWTALRCRCAGTAADGISGKALIERVRPDMILVDIRMPGMDGLEMIKRTRHIQPHCKVVILTGYEQFDYAKKALSLGVDEFLLKPVDIQELTRVLSGLVRKLDREISLCAKHHETEELSLRQARLLKDNSDIRKAYALYRLIGDPQRAAALKILSEEGLGGAGYVVALVGSHSLEGEFPEEEAGEIKQAVLSYAAGKRRPEILSFCYSGGTLALVCFCGPGGGNAVKEAARSMRIALQERVFSGKICAFEVSGERSEPLERFGAVFERTLENLQRKLYFVGSADSLRSLEESPDALPAPLSAELSQLLEQLCSSQDPEGAGGILHDAVSAIARRYHGNIPLVENAVLLFCTMMTAQMIPPDQFEESLAFEEVAAQIKSASNIQKLTDYVLGLYFRCHEIQSAGRPAYSLLIQCFYRYVQENAGKNPTLTEIAAQLLVSPNYLSGLIKKETGENFTDIVIRAKIELSKKYLKNISYRIEDVAELVGYSNYISFYKAFKKYTGLTPKQYRDGGQKGGPLC